MPVRRLGVAFLLIMAAAVAEAVQVVGVLLILTLLITPGATAERLTARPGRAIAYSVGVALCQRRGRHPAVARDQPAGQRVRHLVELRVLPAGSVRDRATVGKASHADRRDKSRRVRRGRPNLEAIGPRGGRAPLAPPVERAEDQSDWARIMRRMPAVRVRRVNGLLPMMGRLRVHASGAVPVGRLPGLGTFDRDQPVSGVGTRAPDTCRARQC